MPPRCNPAAFVLLAVNWYVTDFIASQVDRLLTASSTASAVRSDRIKEATVNHARWLKPLHDPFELRRVTNLIVAEIGKLNPRPSFIAVRGTSGTAIGGAVSLVSDLPMVIVRKETDNSHAKPWGDVQGLSGLSGRFVIVDDLVDTGATVIETVSAVMHAVGYDEKWKTECIAVLLYSEDQIKTGSLKVGETDIPLIAVNR